MNFDDFKENCEKGNCLRNTIKSKNCKKDYKQKLCYNKYITKLQKNEETKNEVDELRLKVCEEVDERDGKDICTIWQILSQEQKQFVLEIYGLEFKHLGFIIDKAHIVPRSQSKELYYEKENIINVSRYFHSLLDTLKNPVTQQDITKKERLQWMNRALSRSETIYNNKLREKNNYGDSTQRKKIIRKRKSNSSN